MIVAADQQFSKELPTFDTVWRLELENGGPISLLSTLGLQARSFQIFPQVSQNKMIQESLSDFFAQPRIDFIYSNFLRMVINPFEEIEAVLDIWVKSASLVLGRIKVTNNSDQNLELGARLAARLISLQGGSDIKHTRQAYQTFLKGQSGNLSVSLTMNGSAKTVLSPTFALEQSEHLGPGKSIQALWQCEIDYGATLETGTTTENFPVNWDAEIARLEVANQSRLVQITTPNTSWDAAFLSNQNQAFQLLQREADGTIAALKNRNIHTTFSSPPAGQKDINTKTVTTLELFQLVNSLMPAQIELAAELFAAHLSNCLDGLIEGNANPLPFPCLCKLAWQIHQQFQDKTYLSAIFPALKSITLSWFDQTYDRDQDGIPEWTRGEQTELTSLSVFDLMDENALSTRIAFTESSGLVQLMLIELEHLRKISLVLEDQITTAETESHSATLQSWSKENLPTLNNGSLLDYQTHRNHAGEILFKGDLGEFGAKAIFLKSPARLNLRLKPQLQFKKPAPFFLHGENDQGELVVEKIDSSDLLWLPGSFYLTTKKIYARLDRISELEMENCQLQVHIADLKISEISSLLASPGPEEESESEDPLSLDAILNRTAYGIPENLDPQDTQQVVNLGWNFLLISQLIDQGERDQAFQLFSQLIEGQILQLKPDHNNSDRWQALTGRPIGTRNTLAGLIPVNLFLELAGIRILHENKLILQGQNPFPWPVKVLFKGLEVTRDGKNSTIRFPNGTVQHHFGSSMKTFSNPLPGVSLAETGE